VVNGDVVVVALGPAGVVGLSMADGRVLWKSDLAGTPVAIVGRGVWLHDTVGRLTALDVATGSRLRSLRLGCFTLPVINTLTERIILASPQGLVASLAPPPTPAAAPRQPVNAAVPGPAAEPAPEDPDATPP
jgi:hypothetical protein